MAALIAPLCVRYAINGTVGDTTFTNIWDVRLLGTGGGGREANIDLYARNLFDTYGVIAMANVSNEVILRSVSWVDLNNAEGTTGSVSVGLLDDPNLPGGRSDPTVPANTAMLIRKSGSGNRGTRTGRMFLPGAVEIQASATSIVSGYQAQVQADMNTFLAEVTDPEEVPGASCLPTVIHTVNVGTSEDPNYVYSSDSLITGLAVQSRLATQRRRLRR